MGRAFLAFVVAGLSISLGTSVGAATLLINNGLAPPTSENVLNEVYFDLGGASDGKIVVRNAGCTGEGPCASPGAATEVLITDGAVLIVDDIDVYDTSQLTMTGGTADNGSGGPISAFDSSTVVISGGEQGEDLRAYDNSTVWMSGGELRDDLYITDNAELFFSGGSTQFLIADGSAQVTISGGEIGELFTDDNSVLTIEGGIIGGAWGMDFAGSSSVTIEGGIFNTYQAEPFDVPNVVSDSATLIIVGTHFEVDGVPVSYGAWPGGILSGTLASGEYMNTWFVVSGQGTIFTAPIPEPSAALVFGLGFILVAARTRLRI
ncbi:MAG: hypothetical protein JRC77_02140 [Deltaproteobacteria bacterium]|nr:hypothetical protein [Deltaproteobacteria bacterium]